MPPKEQIPPVEVVASFFSSVNEAKPNGIDFSKDGSTFVSSHVDDSVRICDVSSLHHMETIQCENFGVHLARFTHSNHVICVAPRHQLDGHLHLLNTETAQFFSALAYLDDVAGEIVPQPNTPVYSTVEQCPVSDVLAATMTVRGSLALFHPLVGGALACSAEGSVVGNKPCISFSPNGQEIAVGDDTRFTLFDRRMLFSKPLFQIDTSDIFSFNTASARCKGIDCCEGTYLLTSSWGETLQYSTKSNTIAVNYFHNEVRRHFLGSNDAAGARYAHPGLPGSCIVHPTSTSVNGRHLLVYEGLTSPKEKGRLLCSVQSKDVDTPLCVAVNPRFNIVASSARSVTWWTVNI